MTTDRPKNFRAPRQWTSARILRAKEPYHFQRQRPRLSDVPRPAQPNTSQPNQRNLNQLIPLKRNTYWDEAFKMYLDRRKASPSTNLELGRLG